MTYSEKLKSPKWQKKRLEILQRDNFTCNHCGNTEQQLQIHHKFYEFGLEPWEYGNDTLVTLCADCHKETGIAKSKLKFLFDSLEYATAYEAWIELFEAINEGNGDSASVWIITREIKLNPKKYALNFDIQY